MKQQDCTYFSSRKQLNLDLYKNEIYALETNQR